jgi:hypothetical protein
MGFKPATKVQKPLNLKRSLDGIEIKPTLFISKNGKKKMAGSIDGEIIVDKDGKVLPLHHIRHNGII